MRKTVTDWLQQIRVTPEMHERLSSSDQQIHFDHVAEASFSLFIACICQEVAEKKRRRIWVTHPSPRQRERLMVELEIWGISPLLLPDSPINPEDQLKEIDEPEAAAEWFAVLEVLASSQAFVVICDTEAFHQYAPSPAAIADYRETLENGQTLDLTEFSSQLSELSYDRQPTVTARGQFAIRGGILDFFPYQSAKPLRLEFFDTELESIREFDVDTQASSRKMTKVSLLFSEPPAVATIEDFFRKDDVMIGISPELSETSPPKTPDFIISENTLSAEEDFTLASYPSELGTFDAGDFVLDELRRESFFKQLNEWKREGWTVGIVFSTKAELERFTELSGQDLERDLGLEPILGDLISSFTLPACRQVILSSSELFGRYRTPGAARRSTVDKARAIRARATLDDIEEGDLVVHYEYGIGRYLGIENEDEGEQLQIEYKGGSILSVPLEQAHLIGKYVGVGGKTPELNKLGNTTWQKNRKSAEKSIMDYAARLLRIQAEREHKHGHAHPPDSRWMFEFEQSFHYTETLDQKQAILDTKHDLEAPQCMDRLICGDVGFGKTEVAIRAAFKVITGGKQVALLCPTTVLAEQHWRTFRERFSDYPMRVELLNRFRKPSEVRETIKGLANGSVDMVIGTHRLISGDVAYKDLGLAIVDEEQRFGVTHKEKFKDLFRQIDVLTLSATPIPRTLYMALMGARDMSTIDTPPPNRLPVATTVTAYDDRIIREAIQREMKRGGQVFFLHNRVKTIEMMYRKLQKLVPEAKILIGHGQMEKADLETVMHTFVAGEADILLATTIIETGIDIPNANTILIDRADRFGLADLYQLRGRVGRAGEKAYAILLLPREMITQGDARKRIHAIKQYTALGSGFKIAMRDLEIRGAGNLLGTKQSGHIAQIGFDLYCQLLRKSVDRLKGSKHASLENVSFKSDFVITTETQWAAKANIKGLLPAFVPTSYLSDAKLRISAYREIAEAVTQTAVEKTRQSWLDKHGRFPKPVENLFIIAMMKASASENQFSSVEISEQRLILHRNGAPLVLDGSKFPRLKNTNPDKKIKELLDFLRSF